GTEQLFPETVKECLNIAAALETEPEDAVAQPTCLLQPAQEGFRQRRLALAAHALDQDRRAVEILQRPLQLQDRAIATDEAGDIEPIPRLVRQPRRGCLFDASLPCELKRQRALLVEHRDERVAQGE